MHSSFLIRFSAVCITLALVGACQNAKDPKAYGSAATRLKPVEAPSSQQLLAIYWGMERDMVDLAVTVSIPNVSGRHPLIVRYARYYDSAGKLVRSYVSAPSELAPLATVEFVVQQRDRVGGPGANFLVEWAGLPSMNEPIIEAVMIGQTGNAGISFTSPGRPLRDEP